MPSSLWDTFEENILGFCNNIFTQEGGTHLAGFKTRFTALINSYARGTWNSEGEGQQLYRRGYQKPA